MKRRPVLAYLLLIVTVLILHACFELAGPSGWKPKPAPPPLPPRDTMVRQ